jgi:hypothetical protein
LSKCGAQLADYQIPERILELMADGALNTVFTKKDLIKYKQSFRRNQNTRKVSLLLPEVEDV